MNHDPDNNDDLHELMLRYLDGALEPAEMTRVEALLVDDAEARELLREIALQAVVAADSERAAAQKQAELRRVEIYQGLDVEEVPRRRLRSRVILPWALTCVSICACIALVWNVVWPGQAATDPSFSTSANDLRLAEVRFAANANLVASPSSDGTPERAVDEGMRLGRGVYVLRSGFLELDFFGGALMAIEGPASIELISQREARLLNGRVTVDAGDTQTAFLLHTPIGEVLDIGTRYGVYVGDSGVTETHVFEGLVDIRQATPRESARRVKAESAVRITTAGVAESFSVSESAFPQASRKIGDLLWHGDFEPETRLRVGRAEPGQWGGDICRVVGESQGIRPFSGEGMLLFQSTGQSPSDGRASPTAASQLSQWIDLTTYRAAIAKGRVRVKLSARFNRVAGDDKTDSQFSIHLESFDVAPEEAVRLRKSRPRVPRSRVSYELLSDSDPESWEGVEAVLALPPNALYLEATVFAFENVSNDQDASSEFDGHFADDLQFELLIEPAMSEGAVD